MTTDTPTPSCIYEGTSYECDIRPCQSCRIRATERDLAECRAALAACRTALTCADAMRNAAVDLMQTHCIPDSRMTDDEVVERMYEIFDGPLQRAYDAARAILAKGEGK